MTSFGDPNAPKFCYGRKEDTPVNWDLNWRNQITKEKREMKHNQMLNDMRRTGQAPSASSRVYHPAHVPQGPSALGRIRLGVCGTFIHEEGPAELATRKGRAKSRGRAASSSRSRGSFGMPAQRQHVGELEEAGGLGRFAGQQSPLRSGRSIAVGSSRSASSSRHTSRSSSELRARLDDEIRARKQCERQIAELMLEVRRLKAGMALRE